MSLEKITVHKKYCNIYEIHTTFLIDFGWHVFLCIFHETLTLSLNYGVQNYPIKREWRLQELRLQKCVFMTLLKKYLTFGLDIWGKSLPQWTTYSTNATVMYVYY